MRHTENKDEGGSTRNNFLRKLANYKWGTNASTIRTAALALCYSVAKYAMISEEMCVQEWIYPNRFTLNNTPCLLIYM